MGGTYALTETDYQRRSIYMRLASAARRDEWWYPRHFCDENYLQEMVNRDHIDCQDDMVRLTERGLRWWATEVRGLLYSKYSQSLSQIRWLSQWIEDESMDIKAVHLRLLRQLDAARSASQHNVPEAELSRWGLKQLVEARLAIKHKNKTYSITGEGVALLRRMESKQPVENDGKIGQPEPVLATAESCNGCDGCIYRDVIAVLAERIPGMKELEQLIRQKMEIERGISTLLDKVGQDDRRPVIGS
jgi:DNA-binding PadR family transcriptional regulator